MSHFVQQQHTVNAFASSDSWVILSPIEQSIKQKIEAVGVPLKDWDINIYRGVLTGCNEAFIINTDKRNEILANCKDETERKRTEELIRPILRGRDIKRYGYEWAGLYLIATFPARHYDIERYPAVKEYLLSFAEDYLRKNGCEWVVNDHLADFCEQKLSQTGKYIVINGKELTINGKKEKARKKTSNKWFETQDSISYWEDFDRPKLVYAELARTGNAFCYDNQKLMLGNTGYILVTKDDNKDKLLHLLAFLNSRVLLYSLNQLCTRFDNNGWRWLRQFVEQLRVPPYTGSNELISTIETTNKRNQYINSEVINKFIYDKFNFSKEEQNYINDALKGY